MKTIIMWWRSCIASLLLTLVTTAAQAEDGIEVTMKAISDQLVVLMADVYSSEPNRNEFFEDLYQLELMLLATQGHFDDQPLSAKITYRTLLTHLEETRAYSSEVSLNTAKSLFKQSIVLCASCHKQDQSARRKQHYFDTARLGSLARAELSFLMREYKSAVDGYFDYLERRPTNGERRAQAFDRVLAISLEVQGDPALAEANIKRLRQLDLLFDPERKQLNDWKLSVKELTVAASWLQQASLSEIDHYLLTDWPGLANAMSRDGQMAHWLLIRHRLNRFLLDETYKEHLPVVFYWLARSDREMSFRMYDFVSRHYLEACIEQYPDHPYAHQCYGELEALMKLSFAVKSVEDLPQRIRTKLNELKGSGFEG